MREGETKQSLPGEQLFSVSTQFHPNSVFDAYVLIISLTFILQMTSLAKWGSKKGHWIEKIAIRSLRQKKFPKTPMVLCGPSIYFVVLDGSWGRHQAPFAWLWQPFKKRWQSSGSTLALLFKATELLIIHYFKVWVGIRFRRIDFAAHTYDPRSTGLVCCLWLDRKQIETLTPSSGCK